MKHYLFAGFLTCALFIFGAQVANGVDGMLIYPLRVYTANGTAALPSHSFYNDPDTGMNRPSANTLALSTGGTNRFTLSTTQLTLTVPISLPNGSGGAPSYLFASGAGIYSGGAVAGDIAFVVNGGTRWTLNSDSIRPGSTNASSLCTSALRCTSTFMSTTDNSGTPGNTTINTIKGRAAVANGAAAVTVTNSSATAASTCAATAETNDATCGVKNCVPGAGTLTINMTAACTAATNVGFILFP